MTAAPGHTKPWHALVALLLRDDPSGTARIRKMVPPPQPRTFRRAEDWLRDRGHDAAAVLCRALCNEIHGNTRRRTTRAQDRGGAAYAWVRVAGLVEPGADVVCTEQAGAVVVTALTPDERRTARRALAWAADHPVDKEVGG